MKPAAAPILRGDTTVAERRAAGSAQILARAEPSHVLPAYIDARPSTSRRAPLSRGGLPEAPPAGTVPIVQYPVYRPSLMFNPGTTRGPWSGFASNVDLDTDLRIRGSARRLPDIKRAAAPPVVEAAAPPVPLKDGELLFGNPSRRQAADRAAATQCPRG